MMLYKRVIFSAAVLSMTANVVVGEDWRGFRGLDRAGVCEGELPNSWSGKDFKWRLDLQTRDVGSVAVIDNKVFLLSMAAGKPELRVLCVDVRSGREVWSRSFPHASNHLHKRNTFASSTPAVDSEYVYVVHSDREHTWVRCLTHQGEEVWSRDLGEAKSQHGFGTSPVVQGDKLILNFSQQGERMPSGVEPGQSRVIAMDRATGETVWETPMTSRRVCYGTPTIHGDLVLCANTGDGVYALSLQTGELQWRLPVFSMRCVSSPVVFEDLVIGTSGSGGGGNHLVAVRIPTGSRDEPEEAYRIERNAPYVPTAVEKDGALFIVDDSGVASCVDAATGKKEWTQRIGGTFSASPILVGDKCLLVNLSGEATIIRASRRFEKLGSVDLGGPVGATPTFVDGRLLLRIDNELVCL